MNTKFKVGQRVKVITASTGTELNVSGWVGEIIEVQSDNFVGIKFAEYPLLYCFTDDGIVLDLEVIPTPKWLPIDKDNLPYHEVISMKQGDTKPYIGFLVKYEGSMKYKYILLGSSGNKVAGLTHYIPLSDLLNLPIAE